LETGIEDAQAGARARHLLFQKARQPVALLELAQAMAARAADRVAKLALGIHRQIVEQADLGKITQKSRDHFREKRAHLRVAEAQDFALIGAAVGQHLGRIAAEPRIGCARRRSRLAAARRPPGRSAEENGGA